jgi:hypothetical protein
VGDEAAALESLLVPLRRRALADRGLRSGLFAAAAIGAWGVVILIAARIWPFATAPAAWGLGAAALAVGAGVWWARRRPTLMAVARTTDARLGLAERLASALAFAGAPGELPALLRADALSRARSLRPADAFPAGAHKRRALIAGAAVLAMGVLAVVPNHENTVLAQRQADQATVRSIRSEIARQARAVQAAAGTHPTAQAKALETALNAAVKQLGAASSPAQAQQVLAQLNDQLQSLDDPAVAGQVAAAAAAGNALSSSPAGQGLASALSSSNLAAAAAQAQALGSALSGLSPSQRAQLAQALGAAAASAQDTALGSSLSQAAGALSSGNTAGARQALSRAAGTLSALASKQALEQALGQAQSATQQAQQQAARASQGSGSGQGQGSGSGQGQGSGSGQGQGSGSGQGQGSGSGQGQGSGSGQGQGSGSGQGQGSGSGQGQGSGSGSSGGLGTGNGGLSGPRAAAGNPSGNVYVPVRSSVAGGPLPVGPLGPGQQVPQTSYQAVLGNYQQVELNALNSTVLAPAERTLVQQYFAGLDQQASAP